MYSVDNLLAQLKNGESADSIAKSFSDALNEAIALQKEEKSKEDIKAKKIEKMTGIIQLVIDFISEFYPEVAKNIDIDSWAVDENLVKETVNEMDKLVAEANSLLALLPSRKSEKPVSKVKSCKEINFNDVINKFFDEYNIK